MSGRFPARYMGLCGAECGDPILAGDEVRYVGDVLMHEECTPTTELAHDVDVIVGRSTDPCPDCHMIHAGGCL